jgi:hypothetical protein
MATWRAAALGLWLLTTMSAWAAQPPPDAPPSNARHVPVAMRMGAHPGYGRVVFDLPAGATAGMTQDGSVLTIRFSGADAPAAGPALPPNVQSIEAADGAMIVTLVPHAAVRVLRLPGRLVLDLQDPAAAPGAVDPPHSSANAASEGSAPAPPTEPAARPARRVTDRRAASPLASRPEAVPAERWQALRPPARLTGPAPSAEPASTAPVGAAPVVAVTATTIPSNVTADAAGLAPMGLVAELVDQGARPVAAGPDGDLGLERAGSSLLRLPFGPQTAAAAFRLGDEAVLVFDERRPVDTARLRDDPDFGGLSVRLLQGGTLLRLKLPMDRVVRLSRSPRSWDVALAAQDAALRPIRPISTETGLRLTAAGPGRVVSVPNPQSGAVLLVGTQLAPGQGVAVARRNPMLSLLATWQGVVVDPASDALVLRAEKDGFVVTGDTPARPLPLAVGDADVAAMADAAALTRRFDFPALPVDALRWRLREAMSQAASLPAQSRTPGRLQVAQALLALGLGEEAQAVLGVIAADDPAAAETPDMHGLSAIAAILAGRLPDATGLDDPRLSGSDEIGFWRAVRLAMEEGGAAAAAPVFAADAKLLLGYPAPLRARLLALVGETMARGGEAEAAARLVAARPEDESLAMARAMLADRAARAGGDPAVALALYDDLAAGRDRLTRVRASRAAVELRLSAGLMTAAQAAEALDRQLYAWRGDRRELALRLRTAALRREAGQWRPGLALLRETAQAWPDQQDAIRQRLGDMFAAALADDVAHPLPPLELVTLAEENADLLPDGPAGRKLAARLADRLAALDLPGRAAATLSRLMTGAQKGGARGELGLRLAALQLQAGDAAAAAATLDASDSPDLPADLIDARAVLAARAMAIRGDLPGALARLAAIDTVASDEARATLLESARDWPAATDALGRLAARLIPPEGPFDAAQSRMMLRLASAAAQAGDEATLARLHLQAAPRMLPGEMARLFGVLTEPPIRDATDLPRAADEVALARAVPEALRSLQTARGPSSAAAIAIGARPMAAR